MTTDFHTPHASGAPLTSAEVNSPLGELDSAIGNLSDAVVSATVYGVVADGVTDNYAALTAAIAALPNGRGTVVLPAGTIAYATALNLSGQRSNILRGQGGVNTSGAAGTTLLYTGTGSQAINMQNAFGCRLQDLAILYSNAGFAGSVVDVRNVSGSDPSYNSIERCTIAGSGVSGAAIGVDLDKTTRFVIRDSLIADCQIGLRGKSVLANYSNQVLIENCSFRDNVVAHIKNPGQAWTIISCEANPLANGQAGFLVYDSGVYAEGLVIEGCWTGDVTDAVNPSTQISVYAHGVVIQGNYIGGNAVTTGIAYDSLSTRVMQAGNRFSASIIPVSGPKRKLWLPAHGAGLDGSSLVTLGSAPDILNAVSLADAATQGAFWTFWLPDDWDGGNFFLTPVWSPGSTDASAHAVRWSMDVVALRGDGGQSPGAGGTTTAFTGVSGAKTSTRVIHDTTTDTGVVPVPGALGANGTYPMVRVNLRRVGGDGADTYVGTVNLIGALITY